MLWSGRVQDANKLTGLPPLVWGMLLVVALTLLLVWQLQP